MTTNANVSPPAFGPAERANAEALIGLALAEDLGDRGDLTAEATIPAEARGAARFVAREAGVLCGLPVVAMLAERFGLAGGFSRRPRRRRPAAAGRDGSPRVEGSQRAILAMERTALNFLQRLSGVATMTGRFVRPGRGDEGGDPRHEEDDAGMAGPGEVRRPVRRRDGTTGSACMTRS